MAVRDTVPAISRRTSLFLDFDGTLVDLASRPDAVVVDDPLIGLLGLLADRLDGRIAIVSGRSIAQLDALLGDAAAGLALSGSHGAEWRTMADGHVRPDDMPALAAAATDLEAFAGSREGLVFERKSFGIGVHYRLAPEHGEAVRAQAARIAAEHGLMVQHGKMMAEVRMPGDKGSALRTLMRGAPFAGSTPLFFGDDVTDEDGFAAAADMGGAGVLIGEARATAATGRIDDVAALRRWLAAAAETLA